MGTPVLDTPGVGFCDARRLLRQQVFRLLTLTEAGEARLIRSPIHDLENGRNPSAEYRFQKFFNGLLKYAVQNQDAALVCGDGVHEVVQGYCQTRARGAAVCGWRGTSRRCAERITVELNSRR